MKKQEGFPGQLSYVIPDKVLEIVKQNILTEDLYITDIGYYPKAAHHFRNRLTGTQQYILIYNIDGFGTIKAGSTEYTIPPDHYFIIQPKLPHTYYADKKNPWSIYWIHFSGEKAKYLAKVLNTPMPVEKSKTSRISDRLSLFNEIFQNLDRGYNNESLEYVNLCLSRLLATFSHISQFRLINEQHSKDPVELSINYMLENISLRLKLSEIARQVNLSPSYFSRLFVSRTGFAPIEYFIQLKIQRTCQLLNIRELTILDVAKQIGIEDQFYFSRLFKKVMNISPQMYRNSRVVSKINQK